MYSNKKIFHVTYPIFLTLVAQNIINVTDTAFLGRVSEVALGASAIGGVFYIAVYMVGFGFSQGAQILIARRNGEKNYAEVGTFFNSGLMASLALALLFFTLSKFLMPTLMDFMVSSDKVYEATIEFLDWRIYGFFFSFLNVMFRALFVGITRTRVLTISAFISAITNVILDWILIFGKFGFPELGIAGAAIASVIAEAATSLYLVIITLKQNDRQSFGILYHTKMSIRSTLKILDISIFIMFQYFISVSTWFIFFILIEKLGERPLAITNIGRSLYTLLMIPGSALSTTVSTLVSNMIGAGEKERVMQFMNRVIKLTMWVTIPITVLTLILPELFIRVYTDDPSLVLASIHTMRIVAIAIIFCSITNIIFSVVIGSGNTRTAFAIEMKALLFYVSYIFYTTMVRQSSVEVVWLSEFVYWIIIGSMGYWYLMKGDWRKKEL